jgi:hypothetical protein
MPHALVLRDDQGREYRERPFPARAWEEQEEVFVRNLLFPPLAPDTRSARLVLERAVVAERTGPVTATVPLPTRPDAGGLPLDTKLALGSHGVRISGVQLLDGPNRRLALRLEPSGSEAGAKLVGIERVHVAGRPELRFLQVPEPPAVADIISYWSVEGSEPAPLGPLFAGPRVPGQVLLVSGPLPADVAGSVTLSFQDALVAIDGPWALEFTVQRS